MLRGEILGYASMYQLSKQLSELHTGWMCYHVGGGRGGEGGMEASLKEIMTSEIEKKYILS